MKLTDVKKAGTVTRTAGAVRDYRSAPGDVHAAIYAAAHYAKRDAEDRIVVPGNSYGHGVFHISRPGEDLSRFAPGVGDQWVPVYRVTPSGDVFQAEARR